MKIKPWWSLSALLVLVAFAAGCASYATHVAPGVEPSSKHRIFVETNLSDNHQIAQVLVNELKAHGVDAQSGPPTMQPDNIDAVLAFQDHWNWDFTDHLVALAIELRDPISGKAIASADYVSPTSIRTPPEQVVSKLIGDLLKAKGSAPRKR